MTGMITNEVSAVGKLLHIVTNNSLSGIMGQIGIDDQN
jgi:hypothetical protein